MLIVATACPDGTARELSAGDETARRWRMHLADNCGRPDAVLAEMRSRGPMMAWLSADCRRTAHALAGAAPGPALPTVLQRWIGATPYADAEVLTVNFVGGDWRGFVGGRACWTLSSATADRSFGELVRQWRSAVAADAPEAALPFESLALRNRVAEAVAGDADLAAAVRRVGYLADLHA